MISRYLPNENGEFACLEFFFLYRKEIAVHLQAFIFPLQRNRTYYLEDSDGYALEWCKAIEETRVHFLRQKEEEEKEKKEKEKKEKEKKEKEKKEKEKKKKTTTTTTTS